MAAPAETVSISSRLEELKSKKKVAFIPFIMAGDPDLKTTEEALKILDQEGAEVIELGVPYSDPLADGPTIQGAHTRGLERGTTLDQVLSMVRRVTPHIKASILMFTYYNPIMRRGADVFCRQAKEAGVAGLLVPDIPLEETSDVRTVANAAGLELVLLTTPTTPPARMAEIAKATQGFLYLVSVAGVTGARADVNKVVEGLVAQLHTLSDKPVAVGFGVSGPSQARKLREWGADGLIVGSALVSVLGESADPAAGLEAMRELARSIRAALD
eukprot:jgi/Botrbrau1/10475/Bobra.0133s0081.1